MFRFPQSSVTPKDARKVARRKEIDDYHNHFFSVEFKDNWLSDPKPLCPECNLPEGDIKARIDPYILELSQTVLASSFVGTHSNPRGFGDRDDSLNVFLSRSRR